MLTQLIPERQPIDRPFVPFQANNIDYRYLTPTRHAEIAKFIANEGRKDVREDIAVCWAAFYEQDESVDVTAIDNYFHGARYVELYTGELKHVFISLEEKEGHGAQGQVEYLEKSLASLFPEPLKEITKENVFSLIKDNFEEDLQLNIAEMELKEAEPIPDLPPQLQPNVSLQDFMSA